MSIIRLEEKHKRAVERIIRGHNRDEIAAEAGISRSTLFVWMKDPMFQAYMEKVVESMEQMRKRRLMPTFFKAVEALEAGLALAIEQLTDDDPKNRLAAPSLTVLASVMKTVHSLERTDVGAPSQITESRLTPGENTDSPPKRTLLEQLLDEVVVEGEKIVEIDKTGEGEQS